tara:strand:- start:527 stop:916 length:390 start_codon:yes stop_codon:yes gene_type:complete
MEFNFERVMKFEEFWKLYPRKVAKYSAKKCWDKLSKKDISIIEKVIDGHLKVWQEKELQFVPHARTWLNQKRYEDELEPLNKKQPSINAIKDYKKMDKLKLQWKEAEKEVATEDEIKDALGSFFKKRKR